MTALRDFVNNVRVHDGSAAVDIRDFDSVLAVSATEVALEESDDGETFTAVDADDLIVPEGGQEQEGAFTVGYRGNSRYLQAGVDTFIVGYNLHRAPTGFDVEQRTQDE